MSLEPLALDLRSARRWSAAGVGFAIFGGLAATIALGFGAYAGQIFLSARYSPEVAALMVAGLAVGLCLAMLTLAAIAVRLARRRVARAFTTGALAAAAPAALSLATRNSRLAGAAAALAFGVFAARRARP